ncbi:MAG: DNA topoisomerase [Nanoarchaeota archaeon]
MPRKQKKTIAETSAEQFFPIEPEDIKHSVEKPYKTIEPSSLITVEKQGEIKKIVKVKKQKRAVKSRVKGEVKKGKREKAEFIPKKVSLKEDGYELVITEKPQAALKIASALGKSVQRNMGSVPYHEVSRNGKKIIVACAVGHLFTLIQTSKSSSAGGMPVFNIGWVPNYIARKGDFSKKYYDALISLVKNAGSITVATDYDIEGEVIGLNAVRFIAGQKDASRMKFSTLTEKELNESYEKKSPTLDWGQAIAGETRHYLDWFYGINLSRALMNAIRAIGKFKIMSIGRVQGPALNLIVQKEKQISSFKTKPYWQVVITLEKPKIDLIFNRDIFKKEELEIFKKLPGKTADTSTEKKTQEIQPNPPFNLTNLQTEAYRLFNLNPGKTLQAAQSLYLSGLISYPRTSSQKLPPSINYREILKRLAARYRAEKLLTGKVPVEGKKTDSAHPSIYPTGNFEEIGGDEKKVYDLIVRRFLSLFCEDAVVENKVITAKIDADEKNVNNEKRGDKIKVVDDSEKSKTNKLFFQARGSTIKKKGWLEIYPFKISETNIPDINGKVKISEVNFKEKETQPPHRFSPASLVSELEKRNLGTKATRAAILETLYDRGYVQDQSIKATPLGISLIETLEKHSPIIIDEALTRNFEREMDEIQRSKKNYLEKEKKVIEEAKETISKISEQFKSQEKEIGKELAGANEKLWQQQREENKLNICPVCNLGSLQIMYSKKTRRSFIGCSKYPECRNTYSLPPDSLIKPLTPRKNCEKCGFPMLLSIRKGKKPWMFCFNPQCETNRERIEEYRRKKKEENENF